MSPVRVSLLVGTISLTLLSAALGQENKPAEAKPPATPDKPEDKPQKPAGPTQGDELIKQALHDLANLGWIETNLWQRATALGVKMEATGRYLAQPAHKRTFYESTVKIGNTVAVTRMISDGSIFYRIEQFAKGPKIIQKYEVKQLEESLPAGDTGDDEERQVNRQLREAITTEHGFAGLRPLLEDLHTRLTFTSVEPAVITLGDKTVPVYRLEGEWTRKAREKIAPPKKPDSPAGASDAADLWEKRQAFIWFPRKCRVCLARDAFWPWASTLWPYRIEWLGPDKVGGPDELLVTLELRDPVLTPPANPEPLFEVKLSPEDEKLVQKANPKDVIETQRQMMLAQRRAELQQQQLKPFSPTELGGTGTKPK